TEPDAGPSAATIDDDSHSESGSDDYSSSRDCAEFDVVQGQVGFALPCQTVNAYWDSVAHVANSAKGNAYAGSTVYVEDQGEVSAEDGSHVFARKGSKVTAGDGSLVEAEDGSVVSARAGSVVNARRGSTVAIYLGATVHIFSGCTISAEEDSFV